MKNIRKISRYYNLVLCCKICPNYQSVIIKIGVDLLIHTPRYQASKKNRFLYLVSLSRTGFLCSRNSGRQLSRGVKNYF